MNSNSEIYEKLEKLRKDQFKIQLILEQTNENFAAATEANQSEWQNVSSQIKDLHQNHTEFAELRMANYQLETIIDEWKKRAIDYLTALENALSNSTLNPMYRKSLEKTRKDFCRIIAPMGLEVITPEPGDPFDERIHQAVKEIDRGSLKISRCEAWGFKSGDKVLKPAQVVLGNKPTEPEYKRSGKEVTEERVPIDQDLGNSGKKWLIGNMILSSLAIFMIAIIGFAFLTFKSYEQSNQNRKKSAPVVIVNTPVPESFDYDKTLSGMNAKMDRIILQLKAAPSKSDSSTSGNIKTANTPGFQYIVQDGDSLWGISRRFYSDGARYPEIKSVNGLKSDRIHAGMILVIPMN